MYRCLPIYLLPLFKWWLLFRYYNSNFFSKWFKNILRTFEAEIAQNLRTPSFNLKNVVLIRKKTCIFLFAGPNLMGLPPLSLFFQGLYIPCKFIAFIYIRRYDIGVKVVCTLDCAGLYILYFIPVKRTFICVCLSLLRPIFAYFPPPAHATMRTRVCNVLFLFSSPSLSSE